MSVRVTALVISHNQPEWLRKTLTALESQTRKVDEIIAVDSSTNTECLSVFEEFKISPVVRRTDNSLSALIAAGVSQAASIFTTPNLAGDSLAPVEVSETEPTTEGQHSWFWLLHDDSPPMPDTLEKLLTAADLSPSVALLGPKQVDPENPNLIVQQGLTLTKLGGIFSLVDNELDQAQHDGVDDVLAVGTAGALIRTDLYRRLQGFDRHAPNLASDIDFSIRARLSGYRVVVVPSAKLLHATLAAKGKRSRRWLQGNPEDALRHAEIHLQLAYLPVLLVWMYAVLLPINGLLRALWRVATKQPALVSVEIAAAFWGFVTIPVRLLSRSKVELNLDISLRSLWPLRATFAMVRHRNRMLQDHVADEIKPVQPSKAVKHAKASADMANELDSAASAPAKTFAAAGGWFVFLALAVSSWQFWPTNLVASGGSISPLSNDWFALASRAGASWQNQGVGLAAPSDPFNWLLTVVGALWFVTPSLALAVAIFLARSTAFSGAWFATALVAKKTWVRLLLALAYSLWPTFIDAQQQLRIGAIFAWMILPWLVHSTSKLLDGRVGRRARGRQSTWVGVSGLLFAAVAVAAPSLAVVALVALVVAAIAKPRRMLALIWVPALAAALMAPYVWFFVARLGKPFALLSDPGLPLDSAPQSFWQILVGVPNGLDSAAGPSGLQWLAVWGVAFAAIAIGSWFGRKPLLAATFTGFAVLAAAVGFVVQQSWFAPLGVHGSAASASALIALSILFAAGLSLDALTLNLKKFAAALGAVALVAIVLGSLGAAGISQPFAPAKPSALSFTDGRTEPAIVAAEATQGSHLRTLKISQVSDNRFDATVVSPGGLKLEANSTIYRYVLAQESSSDLKLKALDGLVANLVSANGTALQQDFAEANIGFVLVDDANSPDLNASLNSVSELEPVGQTEFGWLWRVRDAKDSQISGTGWQQTWSLTKGVQLAFVIIFLLLAIPGSPKRKAKNTGSIFVANDFAENDFSGISESLETSQSPESERN